MKNKKGFTLIELIATITLILLLFIILVPLSLNLIEKSNKEQCEKMANSIEANAELCVLDKNSICINNTSETYYVSLINLYNNGYIEKEYLNKFKDINLSVDENFLNYKVKITKENITSEDNYLSYKLVDQNNNNPCDN